MKTTIPFENDIRHADCRHPVDILEPLPKEDDDGISRVCEVLNRTFGWVADGATVEQKGLRASVVRYCVRADLVSAVTLAEISSLAGFPEGTVANLMADFCHTIGWK